MTTIPPFSDVNYDYYGDDNTKDAIDNYYSTSITSDQKNKIKKYFDDKANCTITSQQAGNMDPTRYAYYYLVSYCENCGTVDYINSNDNPPAGSYILEKKIFYYPEDQLQGSEFYLADENVVGFINNKGVFVPDRIPVDDFRDAVLDNCDMGGYYYLCTNNKGIDGVQSGFSKVERKYKQPGHTWSDPFVEKNGTNKDIFYPTVSDKNVGDTVNSNNWDYLLKGKNGKVVIEEKDGKYVVYGVNCQTNAYYKVVQRCLRCGQNKKDPSKNVGVKTKVAPGPHIYYERKPGQYDPTKTVYTPVDEKHHLEHYKDLAKCQLCQATEYVDSVTPDALVEHTFTPQEVEGTREEPTCGTTGKYETENKCICTYVDKETPRSTVVIHATDKHDFGDNPPQIVWSGGNDGDGAVYIKDEFVEGVSLHADIVRECTVCHQLDSNGINYMVPGDDNVRGDILTDKPNNYAHSHFDPATWVPGGYWCAKLNVDNIDPATKDPATGIAYRCSTAHATISVDWVGTVDGKVVELNKDNADNAVKENVPYYETVTEYQARTAHTPGKPQKEGDNIVTRCTVCGDIVKSEPDTTPSVDVPTVTATSVDFDTVNVSWTKVDGATAYRLYFRSSDEGISKWQKIRSFTGDNTSYAVNGLTTGSKYRFTVRAEVTQDGKTTLGDYSRKGAVAVPKLTAPEIKSVTSSGKITKVTWSRVDGASGYIVFRNSQRVGTVTKGSKVTWTDKKPVSGAKYQVRAYRIEDKKNFKSNLSEPK